MITYRAAIPSPPWSEWELGPFTLRAYALCIVAGIIVAIVLGARRWERRGGNRDVVYDVAVWAVLFGIVGARLYHVITDNHLYFGEGRNPVEALKIWQGGLGIWGAIALGAVGAWIACRRKGIPLPAMADALAPGVVLAQAIGRWGNWFNQELFGRPTDLPWGLEIDFEHRPDGYEEVATFHPTFLYESLWCLAVAAVLLWADRRFRMGHGRVFALYVALYTLGRTFFEYLRIDPATEVLGFRINFLVSIAVCLAAVLYIVVSVRRRPGREAPEDLQGFDERAFADDDADQEGRPSFVADVSDADESDGDVSDGDVSDADESDGDVSDGDVSDGDVSDGDVSDADDSDADDSDADESETAPTAESAGNETDTAASAGAKTDGDESDGDETDGDVRQPDTAESSPS